MIKWYDWIFAFLAADFLMANVALALFAPVWWMQILGGAAAWLIWDLWENSYCKWRLIRERNQ